MTEVILSLFDASVGSTPAERNFRRVLALPLTAWKGNNGELPPHSDDWVDDAVVITGSQRTVSEDREWIERTANWIADAVAEPVPVLGFCWGHQVLAHALGGHIGPMDE